MTDYKKEIAEFAQKILLSDESKYLTDASDALKESPNNEALKIEFLQKKSEYDTLVRAVLKSLEKILGAPPSSCGGGCGGGGCCRGKK